MTSKVFQHPKLFPSQLKTYIECDFQGADGYDFVDWNFDIDGKSKVPNPYVFSEDTSLYGKWVVKTYNVLTNGIGCSISVSQVSNVKFLQTITISWKINSGYKFKYLKVHGGKSSTGDVIYSYFVQDSTTSKNFTMIDKYYDNIYIEVLCEK